jgi:hypothetical protein
MEKIMAWLVMNDEVDYPCIWYPTHIISKEGKPLPVFIGAPQTVLKGFIGLWIRDEHYNLIRHDKAYIFLHDPDVVAEDIQSINWDEISDVKKEDQKSVGREHIHLWKEPEFERQNSEGGTA